MQQAEVQVCEERIANYYKTISAKGKEVMRQKKAEGETMHLAPFGYKNARDELGRSVLVPDPAAHVLLQHARELNRQGMSIRKICAEMEKLGLRGKRGNAIAPKTLWRSLKLLKSR